MDQKTNVKEEIAIIGMAGRFPGAENVDEFWENLCNGVESISFFTVDELKASGVDPSVLQDSTFVNAGGVLEDADCFDASFFGVNPREAQIMDPQHRVFLECAWAALESAGIDPENYRGAIGVFAGSGPNTYFRHNLLPHRDLQTMASVYQTMIGNEADYLATRVSHKLNLRGPSINVQNACSTSGVAVHLACQSLLSGECDMALAGGARIRIPLKGGYFYQEGGIPSPDGHCRAFDAKSRGTVYGSGAAIVVLKRLSEATRDRDCIYAVIKGSAVNNDGAMKAGFTAPSVQGQAAAIAEAHALAEVTADTIGYVEAHGTGTTLGDPIEIAALTKAFRETTDRSGFCALGSVKTNIGHLDAAAGVTGIIKAALMLKHGVIPPSLHFRDPNPEIDFGNSPFYVSTSLTKWKEGNHPRRAGVSSFGLGGTNAHIVLEEAPVVDPPASSRAEQVLVLSGKTESALEKATANLCQYLQLHPEVNFADVAYALQTGRRRFTHCRAFVSHGVQDAAAALQSLSSKRVITEHRDRQDSFVTFMFPGQGAQYVNMGASLYREEPLFRADVDVCAEMLAPYLGFDLRTVLYPEPSARCAAEHRLAQTFVTQPALFVIEFALARLWMQWGIKPHAVIGHSLGEYTAACIAGVFSRDDALRLVAERARLVQKLPGGAMLAIRLPALEVGPLLEAPLSIAAVNAPSLTVVSGPNEAIENLETRLTERRVGCRRLATSHAFHSKMMDPVLKPFAALVRKVRLNPPKIPWVSCFTGDWITETEATDPNYWAEQLRQPVHFTEGLRKLFKDGNETLLEVGPDRTLSTFVKQHPDRSRAHAALTSIRPGREPRDEMKSMLFSLAQLWAAGAEVDWPGVHSKGQRQRIPLPTYPFERKRYWIEPTDVMNPTTKPLPAAQEADDSLRTFDQGAQAGKDETLKPAKVVQSEPTAEVQSRLRKLFADLSGIECSVLDISASFMELGFDSLFLTQASSTIQQTFHVKVSFRQMLEELSTIESLAMYLERMMPPEQKNESDLTLATVPEKPVNGARSAEMISTAVEPARALHQQDNTTAESAVTLERLLTGQLDVLARQLDLIRNWRRSPDLDSPLKQDPLRRSEPSRDFPADPCGASQRDDRTIVAELAALEPLKSESKSFGPYRALEKGPHGALTPHQRGSLDSLIERYTKRTQRSKRSMQAHRAHLADPRSVVGFRLLWKELIYPIVAARSSGCKLWDIDGNEYVDLVSGFGSSIFGYGPPFVTEAIEAQLKSGMEIGPQSPLAGQIAKLICEFTGMERAAFCNTGSEAVLAAIRMARTVTGRQRIALFAGDYHGIFDEVIVKGIDTHGQRRSVPVAPGIPHKMVEDVLVLDYGDLKSLDTLRAHADEVAAVLVEPVQARNPALQPREFLHALRKTTKELDIALVFDEIITGFRVHPGGAQAWFDVQADIATYAKAIGGGMPIAVVAGKVVYMDALDGGMWNYGDASVPEAGLTYFAGTFVRHPLALAAAWAALRQLKESGPSLQTQLNERTTELVRRLNTYTEQIEAPISISHFSSWFYISFPPDLPLASLFFAYMREKGVHILEGRACFLTTAHTAEDLEYVVRAFKETLAEMQDAGFLPTPQNLTATRETPSHDRFEPPARLPLTEPQREVWLATQMGDDASSAFIESVALHMRGPFRLTTMLKAIQELVTRHDSLRSTFSENGEERQVVPDMVLDVPLRDLSKLEPDEREDRFTEIAAKDKSEPFHLSRGPLLRAQIVRLEDQHHVLLLTVHHIVADGWSTGVLFSELGIIYSAYCRGEAHRLALPTNFADYACWLLSQQSNGDATACKTYWLEQFKESVSVLELPADRPRPARKTYSASQEWLMLPSSLCQDLRRVAALRGSTLFTTLLAAFNVLLHRLTDQEDIVVGVPVAGQATFGAQDLVGHCINFLPLRTRINTSARFVEYLGTVKSMVLDAYEHQNYTYGKLLQELKLPRDVSRLPLVSVGFNLDRNGPEPDFDQLDIEVSVQPKSAINVDIQINVEEMAGTLKVKWHYNTDLFDGRTIRRWLRHYQTLLTSIVSNPEQRLSALPILTEAEEKQILVDWNDTERDHPRDKCIHELFEAQVERTPNAPAIIFQTKQLSYRELNQRANQLAHYLRKVGVGPEILVGICAAPSIEMVVGLLAVLKAGGAYMPLNPDHPRDRLAFMLEDAGISVLLTQERLLERLPDHKARVIQLDADGERTACESTRNPARSMKAENLAYVIYTSGSTGRPKGVMISHQAVCNRLLWAQAAYPLSVDDRVLQQASFTFDFSVWEFFGPLSAGAGLVLTEPGEHQDPASIVELISKHKITTVHFVPPMLAVFLAEPGLDGCNSLRRVFCGGEALSIKLQERFFDRLDAELYNQYGPTETTIDVTFWPCQRDSNSRAVPIGRPISNAQLYILDDHLRPVPVGVTGEICIGGVGLARGYLNRPELTAENFVPDPFSEELNARMYKSGDLARYLADGNVEFLGRIDGQVKIRGFRIELGEIEAVLQQNHAVDQAVVLARNDTAAQPSPISIDKQLVAYIVLRRSLEITVSELYSFLRERLPDYMLPSAFVFMQGLALTPSGKIDRKALPKPDQDRPFLEQTFVAPRTPMEEALAAIWIQVLKLKQVGVHDNFFDIGGHSLLGTQVVTRIRNRFDTQLSLRALFERPTIAGLAELIMQSLTKETEPKGMNHVLAYLESLSDDEAQRLLSAKNTSS